MLCNFELGPEKSAHARLRRAATHFLPVMRLIEIHSSEAIWVTGGTLRNELCCGDRPATGDLDLIFYNAREPSRSYEKEIEAMLIEKTGLPNISVKNQARVSFESDGVRPHNLLDSVVGFPDITVAAAARAVGEQTVLFFFPYGMPHEGSAIAPTFKFLSRHSLQAFFSWVDRKKYAQKAENSRIQTEARFPISEIPLLFAAASLVK
jgi:hypothetical protein